MLNKKGFKIEEALFLRPNLDEINVFFDLRIFIEIILEEQS